MLVYIIKSSACLAVFLLIYKLLLEKENMHVFKRFYLLVCLLISFGIPFITFTHYIEVPLNLNNTVISNTTLTPLNPQEASVNYLPYILWSIYLIGVLIFSLKFIFNLSSIILKINQNPKLKTNKSTNVLLEELIVPHTFLSYIFLNKTRFETQQIPEEVLIHEEVHAVQKHSLDILFIELFQIILWFNPLIYMLKKTVKLNHEFIADLEVIKQGVTLSKYQQILLAFSSNALEPQLATAINYSFIKKRFTVMKTHTSKTTIWLRSFVLLPVLALLIYSFSTKKVIEKEIESKNEIVKEIQQETIVTINGIQCEGCKVKLSKEATEKLILGTNTGEEISSFLIKFIGKPTVSITGNKLNKEAIGFLNENESDKIIQIFNIKTTNSNIKMPILIQLADRNDENYSNSPVVKKGEKSDIPPPPPPPPPANPDSPSNFVSAYEKKGASFYYEDEQISSTKASNLLKENKSLNVLVKGSYTSKPKVYLSKEPISIDENIKNVEEIIPPPPPKAPEMKMAHDLPPPPPIPADATPEEKAKYQKTIDKYNQMRSMVKKGEESNIPPPPPPPPPKAPLDFVIEMAKKDATFYFEGKQITSDQAINMLKKNKSLNISAKESSSKNPKVYISKEPITID